MTVSSRHGLPLLLSVAVASGLAGGCRCNKDDTLAPVVFEEGSDRACFDRLVLRGVLRSFRILQHAAKPGRLCERAFCAVSPIMNCANSLAALGLGEPLITDVGDGITNTPSGG